MEMATKSCKLMLLSTNAFSWLRCSSTLNKLPEKVFNRHVCHSSLYGPSVGGVSLQSLPGNRLLQSGVLSPYVPSWVPSRARSTRKADIRISMNLGVCGIENVKDFTPLTDEELQQDVTDQINENLEQGNAGRLFAVVYIRGMQHKVSPGDLIIVKLDFPPNIGDNIRLEKVMTVGGRDFSLVGQPILGRDAVRVDATVVEKTMSHNRVWFVYRKRRNFKRLVLYREMYTVLAINSIQVAKLSDQHQEINSGSAQQQLD